MEADYIDKIFDRFTKLNRLNLLKNDWSGISFLKKIIELHHGTIEVKSRKDSGTEFIIKLSLNLDYQVGEIDNQFINTDDIKKVWHKKMEWKPKKNFEH
jgi:K+-sensing histidine kinase KdpD